MLNSKLVTFGLGSIALHLALVSILSAHSSQKPIDLVYLPAVQIDHRASQKVSPPQRQAPKAVSSGSTQSSDGATPRTNSFATLQESLYRALNENLKNRAKSSEMLLALEFSQEGKLENTEVLQSSGEISVDTEVVAILKRETIFSSPDFANIRIKVPVRLR